jgi:Na+/phosphate symporter
MKKVFQSVATPMVLFGFGIVMLGCGQTPAPEATAQPDTQAAPQEATPTAPTADLKSGNMFYIVRDVADVQLKAGSYIEQLQQTQTDLQDAVNLKDHQKLESAAQDLQSQLTSFNTALNSLDLKSQEINDIRRNIIEANQKVLASDFLNGQLDFAQVDFKQIEAQMGNVQGEMLKLAAMLIPQEKSES